MKSCATFQNAWRVPKARWQGTRGSVLECSAAAALWPWMHEPRPSLRLSSGAALRLVSSRLPPQTQPRARPLKAKSFADAARAGRLAAGRRDFRAGRTRREKIGAPAPVSALQKADGAAGPLAPRSVTGGHCPSSSLVSEANCTRFATSNTILHRNSSVPSVAWSTLRVA